MWCYQQINVEFAKDYYFYDGAYNWRYFKEGFPR